VAVRCHRQPIRFPFIAAFSTHPAHLPLDSASSSIFSSHQRRRDTDTDSDGGTGSDGEADYVGGPNQHLLNFLRLPHYQELPPHASPAVPQAKVPTAEGARRWEEALQRPIAVPGLPDFTLEDRINVELDHVARCVLQPGSHIVLGPEQSDKTMVIAGVAVANIEFGVSSPCMVCVKDQVNNVKDVQQKMNAMLECHGIKTMYICGKTDVQKLVAGAPGSSMDDFLRGRLLLVFSSYTYPLSCIAAMLELFSISDVLLIADECDALWAYEVPMAQLQATDWAGLAAEFKITKREAQMYRILGVHPLNRAPGERCSRVRSFIQISATQVATLAWHNMWSIDEFYGSAMRLTSLEESYTLYADLKAMKVLRAAEPRRAQQPHTAAACCRLMLIPQTPTPPSFCILLRNRARMGGPYTWTPSSRRRPTTTT
jgi:hypothetical protein